MGSRVTFFEWEDSFVELESITADIYVNNTLRMQDVKFKKIDIARSESGALSVELFTEIQLYSELLKSEEELFSCEIKLSIKKFTPVTTFNEICLVDASCTHGETSIVKDYVKTVFSVRKIEYLSDMNKCILKEWYGCSEKMNLHGTGCTYKKANETILYTESNRTSFKLEKKHYGTIEKFFWVKFDDYKFKVILVNNQKNDKPYYKYAIEYRSAWGSIPNEDVRLNIANFLSFIIGAKLVKFGETYFNGSSISQKEYLAVGPIETSLLYLRSNPFYNQDYRRNDTVEVIKRIPKMLRRYFELKEQYRFDEVFYSLCAKSYLDFNFINYVTCIEMLANVEIKKMNESTVISTEKFKDVLTKLQQVKGVPKKIRDKLQNLNNIGIGKKIEKVLKKYKIDYAQYKSVFDTRGKVVHGSKVDVEKMIIASQKAKELLTILTLKKLGYTGYIRDFTDVNKLILLKDMSKHVIP